MTTEEYANLILLRWNLNYVPYYLAQILSGEKSVDEARDDIMSFERTKAQESKDV